MAIGPDCAGEFVLAGDTPRNTSDCAGTCWPTDSVTVIIGDENCDEILNCMDHNYDNDDLIDLKSPEDSFASAANYINKLGWNNNEPCFYKIKLKENIPVKYLNTSAKKIKNKKKN